PERRKRLGKVYEKGEVHSFEVDYSLGSLHRNKLLSEQNLAVRVNFLPLKDRYGKVTRVLVQLQDFSREQIVDRALREQDHLLYSLINNSRSLMSVKSTKGKYLLANQSFAQWLGRDE